MGGKAGEPTFTVCRNAMDHNENSTLAYIVVYDKDGNALRTIAEGISDAILLSDVKGLRTPGHVRIYRSVGLHLRVCRPLLGLGRDIDSAAARRPSLTAAVDRALRHIVPLGVPARGSRH